MVTVSYPGVYIKEVPSGVHTISGVSTSIAAFIGRSAKGPVDKAVRILSYPDFKRAFGGPHPSSDLAQSVQHFFANGGSDCYVVRLAPRALAASVTLRSLVDLQDDFNPNNNVLLVTAKSQGTWGNGIRLVIDYSTLNPDETFNLRVVYAEEGRVISEERFTSLSMMPDSPRFAPLFVSQSSDLINMELHPDVRNPEDITNFNTSINDEIVTPAGYSQSRRPFDTIIEGVNDYRAELTDLFEESGQFLISVNGSDYLPVDLTELDVSAVNGDETEIANAIATEINGQLPNDSQVLCTWDQIGSSTRHVLRITSDDDPKTSVHIRRALRNDLAGPLMLGLDQGGIEVFRFSNLRPRPNGLVFLGDTLSFDGFTNGINLLSGLAQNAITGLAINGLEVIELGLPNIDVVDRLWYEHDSGTDGVLQRLGIIAQEVTDNSDYRWRGELWGYHLAFILRKGR